MRMMRISCNFRAAAAIHLTPVVRHKRPAPASPCALSPDAREAGLLFGQMLRSAPRCYHELVSSPKLLRRGAHGALAITEPNTETGMTDYQLARGRSITPAP